MSVIVFFDRVADLLDRLSGPQTRCSRRAGCCYAVSTLHK